MIKNILLVASVLLNVSCATVAHRSYACQEMKSQTFGTGWLLWLMGATIQQGDCAIVEPLKYETGWYYNNNKDKIDFEVQTSSGVENENTPALEYFAKVYNCSPQGYVIFKKKLLENRNGIFGSDFKNSGRIVMLSINDLVKHDAELHPYCPI